MLVVGVKAMDGQVGGVGIVDYIVERGDDGAANDIKKRGGGPVEGGIDEDRDGGKEQPEPDEGC